MSKTPLQFTHVPHPSPLPAEKRAELLKNPGFGRVFSDHMVTIRYHESKGWHDARVEPRAPIPMDPAAAVLHYAQEIFEGLKAYRTADGGATLFRPLENAAASSSRPSGWPCRSCPRTSSSRRSTSGEDRPGMDPGGRRQPLHPAVHVRQRDLPRREASSDYLFIVIASSVGAYFKTDAPAVSVWVSDDFTRAAPAAPAPPSAAATMPPACRRRRRRRATAATRSCSSMPSNSAGSRSWAA